jgi:hypothetical protein
VVIDQKFIGVVSTETFFDFEIIFEFRTHVRSLSPPKPAGLYPPNICRQTLCNMRKAVSKKKIIKWDVQYWGFGSLFLNSPHGTAW